MKIVVYAIALNEVAHVERFLDACEGADWVYIGDTGSTDTTVEHIENYGVGVSVYNLRIKPWRFDDARNALLSLLPADVDVCVSADLDEVLQPGWRQEIERVWMPETTRLRYGFDWGRGIQFQYEKIHARFGYRWFGPVHEYPVPDRIEEVWAETDKLLLVHQPDSSKSRGQYLDLLRISIEENPTEPRNAFYYARELSFHWKWREAIVAAQRYLDLPKATWPNERCYALRVMGRAHQELGEWERALSAHRNACSAAPDTREPWYELSVCCYRRQRWAEGLGAALTCLSIQKREKLYTVDPEVWGAAPHDMASIAAYNLGQYGLALEHARAAVLLDPNDLRLRRNLEFCEAKAA